MNTTNISDKRTLLLTSLLAIPACQSPDADSDWFPAVDLADTGHEYVFDVDLPGLLLEDINLEVDSAAISISGMRVPRSPAERWLRVERPAGAFTRQLPLPPNSTGEIYGSFADGVLELRLPKFRPGTKTRPAQAVIREPAEVAQ